MYVIIITYRMQQQQQQSDHPQDKTTSIHKNIRIEMRMGHASVQLEAIMSKLRPAYILLHYICWKYS